jgi:hypothetical protein
MGLLTIALTFTNSDFHKYVNQWNPSTKRWIFGLDIKPNSDQVGMEFLHFLPLNQSLIIIALPIIYQTICLEYHIALYNGATRKFNHFKSRTQYVISLITLSTL